MAGIVNALCRGMSERNPLTPKAVEQAIEQYLAERQEHILPSGEQAKDGRRFAWCGDVLEFLTEGLAERVAALGLTFTTAFPGPLKLMDEEQRSDGQHVRRFWTVALDRGCPIARLCTYFYHRHDQVTLPRLPKVVAYPPDHVEGETP